MHGAWGAGPLKLTHSKYVARTRTYNSALSTGMSYKESNRAKPRDKGPFVPAGERAGTKIQQIPQLRMFTFVRAVYGLLEVYGLAPGIGVIVLYVNRGFCGYFTGQWDLKTSHKSPWIPAPSWLSGVRASSFSLNLSPRDAPRSDRNSLMF